jgi:hypothetical protein
MEDGDGTVTSVTEDVSTAPLEKNDNDLEEQSTLSLKSTESSNNTTNQISTVVT